jgi:geranylgeranyl diphosphate synthase, type I
MSQSTLAALQTRFGPLIDERIRAWISLCDTSPPFAGMMRYQMGFVDHLFHETARSSGKRFRPVLCLLACQACGGEPETALDVAAAIELLHNFSLIHDDIEDRDPTRRHQPTVWKLWGEAQGINAGDGMFALASRACLSLDKPAHFLPITRLFQETALTLTEGQYLDMSFEARHTVTETEYLGMIEKKTAALIRFSTSAGAVIADASPAVQRSLGEFGRCTGMAFQMYDDIMGIWGASDITGKAPGKDLENRKKTQPILHAAHAAKGADAALLSDYLRGDSVDFERIRSLLDRLDIRATAEATLLEYLRSALAALQAAHLPVHHEQELAAVAAELTGHPSATS